MPKATSIYLNITCENFSHLSENGEGLLVETATNNEKNSDGEIKTEQVYYYILGLWRGAPKIICTTHHITFTFTFTFPSTFISTSAEVLQLIQFPRHISKETQFLTLIDGKLNSLTDRNSDSDSKMEPNSSNINLNQSTITGYGGGSGGIRLVLHLYTAVDIENPNNHL